MSRNKPTIRVFGHLETRWNRDFSSFWGYNRGMDQRRRIPTWLTPFNVAGTVFVVATAVALPQVFGDTQAKRALMVAVLVVLAPIACIAFILGVVRWINRRDDPHHARRPPDPP